jgi:hypothetical protein
VAVTEADAAGASLALRVGESEHTRANDIDKVSVTFVEVVIFSVVVAKDEDIRGVDATDFG